MLHREVVIRCVSKAVIVFGFGIVVFYLMQVLFAETRCFDCGAQFGFPFHYMQDGTYATIGHVIWRGFLADFAIALAISTLAVSVFYSRKKFSNAQ